MEPPGQAPLRPRQLSRDRGMRSSCPRDKLWAQWPCPRQGDSRGKGLVVGRSPACSEANRGASVAGEQRSQTTGQGAAF